MNTCSVCFKTDNNVHEYPTSRQGRDTTDYCCDDPIECLNRLDNRLREVKNARDKIQG